MGGASLATIPSDPRPNTYSECLMRQCLAASHTLTTLSPNPSIHQPSDPRRTPSPLACCCWHLLPTTHAGTPRWFIAAGGVASASASALCFPAFIVSHPPPFPPSRVPLVECVFDRHWHVSPVRPLSLLSHGRVGGSASGGHNLPCGLVYWAWRPMRLTRRPLALHWHSSHWFARPGMRARHIRFASSAASLPPFLRLCVLLAPRSAARHPVALPAFYILSHAGRAQGARTSTRGWYACVA